MLYTVRKAPNFKIRLKSRLLLDFPTHSIPSSLHLSLHARWTGNDSPASIHISIMKGDAEAQPQSGRENPQMVANDIPSPSLTVHRVAVDAHVSDSCASGWLQCSDLDGRECLPVSQF